MRFTASLLLVLVGFISLPASISACPLCKDAISTSDDDAEINNAPGAYNTSIYLMAGMPYLLLASFGFLVYRGCQKNAQHRRLLSPPEAAPGEEAPPPGQ